MLRTLAFFILHHYTDFTGHAWVCAILADDVEYAGDCGILTVSAKADSNANNSDLLSEKFIERVGFVA